ncbi:MAG: anti-sigma factor antagonist [Lachnospiraceae bacterium]|nr:anti-sigma factor antagonist [Lachnospiraceae bacterium]
MENVSYKKENEVLTIRLSGHIDSANASAAEEAITAAREDAPSDHVVVDCEKLTYVSSAGLRVILRLKKAVPNTELINVSSEVYEIFEMTGFTEMMSIQKAYRKISVKGCEVIGQGANGKVYRIDRDTIVKVYLNPDSLPEIHRERELARTAFVLGVPTAIPYDVVRIEGGGYGSVFELLNAKSFAQLLRAGQMSVDEVAKRSIELLKIIHGTVVKPGSMPDMKAIALNWAEYLKDHLPADQYQKLHALIEEVPEDNHMLHGDYHMKNVMLQNGESLLIDMDTLCHGHPIFEFASMYNAYVGFRELERNKEESFMGVPFETSRALWKACLHDYFEGRSEQEIRAIEEKAQIIGYTRIMRRRLRRDGYSTAAGRAEIENCARHLAELLPKTDTLLF